MDKQEVIRMLDAGMTYTQIGNVYGATRNSVSSFIRRKVRGIPDWFRGSYEEWRQGAVKPAPVKKKEEVVESTAMTDKKTPRVKPTLPYVPKVTEDGRRYIDVEDIPKSPTGGNQPERKSQCV